MFSLTKMVFYHIFDGLARFSLRSASANHPNPVNDMRVIALTILAACGMTTTSNPVELISPPEAPTIPLDWRDAYVPGSLREITDANISEIEFDLREARIDARDGEDSGQVWPIEATALELIPYASCKCVYSLSPVDPPSYATTPVATPPLEWFSYSNQGCQEISTHDGKWWIGTKLPVVWPPLLSNGGGDIVVAARTAHPISSVCRLDQ